MRVVLFQSVASLGLAGVIVEVKPGYFRNYLEPRGLALRESPSALRLLASRKKKIELMLVQEKSRAQEISSRIAEITLNFTMKAGEEGRLFGSVTGRDIMDALAQKGIEVDRHKIEIPDAIKTIGEHTARVRLFPEVVAELKIIVEAEKKQEEEAQEEDFAQMQRRRRSRRGAAAAADATAEAPEGGEAPEASAAEGASDAPEDTAPAAPPEA